MEIEVLDKVLNEILEEQKNYNKAVQEQNSKLDDLTKKVQAFEQQIGQLTVTAPPIDMTPIINILTTAIREISRILNNQPKNVIRQVRLILFPESNPDRYYRIVFGRLIPCAIFISGVFLLIPLGEQYVSSRTQLQQRRYYFEVYRDAWERLDSTSGKSERLKMKQVLQKAVNDHQGDE